MTEEITNQPDSEMPEGNGAAGAQIDPELTLEQLKAKLLEAQKKIKELNNESAVRRKKLEAYEKAEKDKADADLSEIERLKKEIGEKDTELATLKTQIKASEFRKLFEKTAAELKIEFASESAEKRAYADIDREAIGDDAEAMKKALQDLVKTDSYLVKPKQTPPEIDAQNKGRHNGSISTEELKQDKRSAYGSF